MREIQPTTPRITYITGYTTIARAHKGPIHRSRGYAYKRVSQGKLPIMKVDGTTFIYNNQPVNHDLVGLTRATKAAQKLRTSASKVYDAVLCGQLEGFMLIGTLYVRADDPALLELQKKPSGSIARLSRWATQEYARRRKEANRTTRKRK